MLADHEGLQAVGDHVVLTRESLRIGRKGSTAAIELNASTRHDVLIWGSLCVAFWIPRSVHASFVDAIQSLLLSFSWSNESIMDAKTSFEAKDMKHLAFGWRHRQQRFSEEDGCKTKI